jgi:hypothetical protein
MGHMQHRKIKNRSDAESCLNAAAVGAQTPTEWARANGVDGRSLHCWRMAIEGGRGSAPLRLMELVVAPSAPPSYTVRCGAFEVDTPQDFDDAVLGRLLRVVAGAC